MVKSKFFAYSWHIDDNERERTVIRIYGLNEQNENVCVVVNNFKPYVYVELPNTMKWDESQALLVTRKIDALLGNQKPFDIKLEYKKRLYYVNKDKDGNALVYPYLRCEFSHHNDIHALRKKIFRPLLIPGIGNVKLRLHETSAKPVLQLVSQRNLPPAGWIKFSGKKVDDDNKVSRCPYEYIVKWDRLQEDTELIDVVARPLLMGYDIEVNSSVPSSMPKAGRPEDKIFQISCVLARQGDENSVKKYLLTLGEPDHSSLGDDIEPLMFETEHDLLLGFTDFIQEHQPNIIIGYNIFTFDIPYMIQRAVDAGCIYEFDRQGLDRFGHAQQKNIKWSSSAYKNQSFEFLDAEGRLFVDLLPIVKRDYKLSNYKLKTISAHLLDGQTKDPLDAKGIFKCYRLGMKGGSKGNKALGICGKYCVQDSNLVVKLFEVMTTWVALCEMSKVTNVPIFNLYTQGQQLKIYSQVYKKCTRENIIVEDNGYVPKDDEHYVGATVFPPIAGVHDRVLPFDFSSLYPTTIIAYNISWDTLVPEDSTIPDSECHVMEWTDHVGCVHDPKEIRKGELNKIIKKVEAEMSDLRKERDLARNRSCKPEFQARIDELKQSTKPYREERSQLQKSKPKHKMCCKRHFRWLKSPMGVLPEILTHLLDTRKATKKVMKDVNKRLKEEKMDEKEYYAQKTYSDVLDKRQLALKISANSAYGALGVQKGYLPLMPGAMCTTYKGRLAVEEAAESIQKDHRGKLIYGDSVTGDTPILVRYANGGIDLIRIDAMAKKWVEYDEFKYEDSNRKEKEQCLIDAEVWTKGKWSKITRVIRHKTKKKLYRVLTHTGCIDVTEDHSLLDESGNKIKPCDVKVGTTLLHSFPEEFEEHEITMMEGTFNQYLCVECKKKQPEYEFYEDYKRICKRCTYYKNHKGKNYEETRPYFSAHEYMTSKTTLSKEEAFVWGFFMADGSGGKYDGGKCSWAINNTNLDYLNRTKAYLEKVEPNFIWKINDTMKSSNVYKLVPCGQVRLIAEKYHQIFYSGHKEKVVPYAILNASREIKEWFFEGYYTGDGAKTDKDRIIPKSGTVRMDCKGKIGSQGLFVILKAIGYKNVSINTRESKSNIFRINATRNKMRKNPVQVKKIIEIGYTQDEFVYDLETAEGIFHAGIGEMIVKNTDSNYITFPHLKTAQECWDYSEKVAKEVTKLFPKPINNGWQQEA